MAKPVDESKIERIREAAVSVIVSQGLQNASVAAIAERAGVSVGYLYRFYESKNALINDLLALTFDSINERISSLIEENKGLEHIVTNLIRYIISAADEDGDKIRFIISILNDLSLEISGELSKRIDVLAEELMVIARKDPGVREDTRKVDIFVAMVGMPMNYLSTRYNGIIRSAGFEADDTEHIVRTALNMIFKDKINDTER